MPRRFFSASASLWTLATLGSALVVHGALARPWPWLAGAAGLALARTAYRAGRAPLRASAALGAALMLTFAAVEATLALAPELGVAARFEGSYAELGAWARHPDLGYAPPPGLSVGSRRVVHGRAVYDVTYTYDEHGLRRTPTPAATPPATPAGSVLCFGCSFTLGEGVEDDEAYPAQLALRSGGALAVHNYGFHGYGPHQMLARLQAGLVEPTLSAPPRHVVYLALTDHMTRAAGLKSWDPHGPWFEREGERAVRRGTFDARPWPPLASRAFLRRALQSVGARSALYTRLRQDPYESTGEHERLFEALVLTTRDEVARRFPSAQFHVIAWDLNPGWNETLTRLAARGIAVHRVSAIIGEDEAVATLLIPGDLHPTPATHARLASHVASLLGP